jgi:PKD repeat protein
VFFNSDGTTYFGGATPTSFAWSFGDGGSSTLANPSHVFSGIGTYNVRLTVTDSLGRTGTGTVAVTVSSPTPPASPVAAFTSSPPSPSLGAGGRVFFDGSTSTTPSGSAIVTYRWNFGDGTIISGAPGGAAPEGGTFRAPQHVYGATGSYTVTLTVTDGNGLSGSTTATVTIVP